MVVADTSTVRFTTTVRIFQHLANFYNYKLVYLSLSENKLLLIVTAAVYWDFSRRPDIISPASLIDQHWAGVSPYTSPYGFAETCVLVKQSLSVVNCVPRKACAGGKGISQSYA